MKCGDIYIGQKPFTMERAKPKAQGPTQEKIWNFHSVIMLLTVITEFHTEYGWLTFSKNDWTIRFNELHCEMWLKSSYHK